MEILIFLTSKPLLLLLNVNKEWKILIGFSYSSKRVGCSAISMSFLNFLSQKTYSGEFSRPKVV